MYDQLPSSEIDLEKTEKNAPPARRKFYHTNHIKSFFKSLSERFKKFVLKKSSNIKKSRVSRVTGPIPTLLNLQQLTSHKYLKIYHIH
jgi:hypothetical protein